MNQVARPSPLPDAFDACASEAACVDRFCSSSIWTVPAHEAFHASQSVRAWHDGEGYIALSAGFSPHVGGYLTPVEAVWGLASPVVHADPIRGASHLRDVLRQEREWQAALVSGIERDSILYAGLVTLLGARWTLRPAQHTTRHQASLADGWEGYLSRRTRKFRANLRRDRRRAAKRGVSFEQHALACSADVDALWERVTAIELQSWKSLSGNGVAMGPMALFTPGVLRRAADAGSGVILFARCDGEDIGYLHGGLVEGHFRGLQMSFAEPWRAFGVGNLLQSEAIRWSTDAGAEVYDLGSELPYKRRWAEREYTTVGLLVSR